MSMVLLVLSTSLAAFVVWLAVRVINRQRRPTARFWAAVGLAIVLAYPLSFGPYCWMDTRHDGPELIPASKLYYPIVWLASRSSRIHEVASRYAEFGASEGWRISLTKNGMSWYLPGTTLEWHTSITLCFVFPRDPTQHPFLVELAQSGRAALSKTEFDQQDENERVFSAIWQLESELSHGGFDQYFRNTDSEVISLVPPALRTIGAEACAQLVEQAMQIIPPLPSTLPDREAVLDALSDEAKVRLRTLDSEFLTHPDDLADLLFEFVAQHPETFGPAPNDDADTVDFDTDDPPETGSPT